MVDLNNSYCFAADRTVEALKNNGNIFNDTINISCYLVVLSDGTVDSGITQDEVLDKYRHLNAKYILLNEDNVFIDSMPSQESE